MESNNYIIPLLMRHLKFMGVKCDPEKLQLVLLSSPSFLSVLSIVQAYTYFGLKASAYRADFMALEKATLPVIAHIKQNNTERFILIEGISENEVSYYDAYTNKKREVLKDDFCTLWTKVIVLSEKTENLFCHKIRNKRPVYWFILFLLCLSFPCLRISLDFQTVLFFYGLLGLKLAGIWLSTGLHQQEVNGTYSVFNAFCHRNEAFDCEKVIHSNTSKLLNGIAFADIGLVYFTMGAISLCIGVLSGTIILVQQILFYLSVCSIPFILFSLFFQKIVVKKWCPLCLSVVALLVIEVVFFLFFPYKVFSYNLLLTTGYILFSLLSSIGLLFLIKQNIRYKAEAFNVKVSSLQLKRTPLIIATVFGNQKYLPFPLEDSLIVGNREAPVTITTLLNPMCAPCKKLAVEMIDLLENYSLFVQWHVRLDGTDKQEYEKLNNPQFHFFALFNRYNSDTKRMDIMKEWFRLQSLPKFVKNYPIENITKETVSVFSYHVANNNKLNTKIVPSVWINNRAFPKEYSLGDIPFLLTDIGTLLKSIT